MSQTSLCSHAVRILTGMAESSKLPSLMELFQAEVTDNEQVSHVSAKHREGEKHGVTAKEETSHWWLPM